MIVPVTVMAIMAVMVMAVVRMIRVSRRAAMRVASVPGGVDVIGAATISVRFAAEPRLLGGGIQARGRVAEPGDGADDTVEIGSGRCVIVIDAAVTDTATSATPSVRRAAVSTLSAHPAQSMPSTRKRVLRSVSVIARGP